MLPKARVDRIVVEPLGDEVLVYDLERHRAHNLNRVAAAVWRALDGRSDAQSVAARVAAELSLPIDEEVVWLAVERLEKARLVEAPARPSTRRGVSRRRVMVALAVAPAVLTVLAPTPAQAASCIPAGGSCNGSIPCCRPTTCTRGSCQ